MRYIKFVLAISIFSCWAIGYASAEEEIIAWETCVKVAKAKHPNLISAAQKISQLKASKEITRSATLPQITGNASEVTSKGATFGSAGGSTTSDIATGSSKRRKTTYDYSIEGRQLLFDGFKTSFDLSSAERNIIASRYDYDVTSSNIRLNLRTAYANLLAAQEYLKVTEEIEARRKQTYELVKLRYEGGREHRGSLLTSEADLAQAKYDVDQAKRSIYLAQRQVTKEMGRTGFLSLVATGDLEVKETARERPDFENIAQTTPLLQQLIAKKDAAKFGLSSAKAAFFPQVYVSGDLGNTNVDAFPDKNEWSIGTNLMLPIFDGGNLIASMNKAKAALGQAEADERSGRDSVIVTLSSAWITLQNALDNVAVKKKFLEATQERAKISTAEYSIGLLIYDNWIIIEDNLVSAKKNYVTAQRDALVAEASWIQAKGGTLDYDEK
ncbi:MAG: TolC family protein [Candidatus Omnitrophica bacterium]|nr:TolC family protein [Candidatus Omnitrophota bacterium]